MCDRRRGFYNNNNMIIAMATSLLLSMLLSTISFFHHQLKKLCIKTLFTPRRRRFLTVSLAKDEEDGNAARSSLLNIKNINNIRVCLYFKPDRMSRNPMERTTRDSL
jgi:hypothetical protein